MRTNGWDSPTNEIEKQKKNKTKMKIFQAWRHRVLSSHVNSQDTEYA
jgi:hypothetical protein